MEAVKGDICSFGKNAAAKTWKSIAMRVFIERVPSERDVAVRPE